ncbi:MAG: SBBP repeat-containing protein [Rhodospirillales bacterium]|nr:SBBP repeat-containing protein [Rhodospirillales bacterium]
MTQWNVWRAACGALIAITGLGCGAAVAAGADPQWIAQLGSPGYDSASGIATDADGNVFVVGYTNGYLGGSKKGSNDAWVTKLDASGEVVWKRQPGTTFSDRAWSVAVDGDGNAVVRGNTTDTTGGRTNYGWVTKFSADGPVLWRRRAEQAEGIAVDGIGNVYVPGSSITKFDPDGTVVWRRRLQTNDGSSPYSKAAATDAEGNVYAVGWIVGSLYGAHKGDFDGWVVKYDADGHLLWKRQPGTAEEDLATGVATDVNGNVFVAGRTTGALGGSHKSGPDAWVIKYDPDGRLLWKRQPGATEDATGIATDAAGNAYVVGYDYSSTNRGEIWVLALDADGRWLWQSHFGTANEDLAWGVATDPAGNVFVGGDTFGSLGGTNLGTSDAFVAKFAAAGTP